VRLQQDQATIQLFGFFPALSSCVREQFEQTQEDAPISKEKMPKSRAADQALSSS